MMSPEYVVFSSMHCSFCNTAKSLLHRRGFSYHAIDIDRFPALYADALERFPTQTTIPLIISSRTGQLIGGFTDLERHLERAPSAHGTGASDGKSPSASGAASLKWLEDVVAGSSAVDEPGAAAPKEDPACLTSPLKSLGGMSYRDVVYVGFWDAATRAEWRPTAAIHFNDFTRNLTAWHKLEEGKAAMVAEAAISAGCVEMLDGSMVRPTVCCRGGALNFFLPAPIVLELAQGALGHRGNNPSDAAWRVEALVTVVASSIYALRSAVQQRAPDPAMNPLEALRRQSWSFQAALVSLHVLHVCDVVPSRAVSGDATPQQELPRADISPSSNSWKATLINLYNITVLLMSAQQGHYATGIIGRYRFFSRPALRIGGLADDAFSLDDIENGLLRGNRKSPMALIFRPFCSSSDLRARFSIDPTVPVDFRIHGALNCGASSCPPVKLFVGESLDQQLNLAARSFISASTNVQTADSSGDVVGLSVSKVLGWYADDFGGDAENIAAAIAPLLPASEQAAIKGAKQVKLSFAPYNWAPRMWS